MAEKGIFLDGNGTNALIRDLSDRIDTFIFLLEAFDDFVKRFPFIIESLNEEVVKYREVIGRETDFTETLSKLSSLIGSREFSSLLDAIGESAAEVKENNYRTSITGLLRALTDEDIQRSLAFLLLVLKKFGESLRK